MNGPQASRAEAEAILPVVPVVRFDGQPLTDEQVAVLRGLYSPAQLESLKAWAQRYVLGLNQAFEGLRDAAKGMGLWMDPGEEYDTRERALAARRNRNTGPARPSAAAARRPRRHQ